MNAIPTSKPSRPPLPELLLPVLLALAAAGCAPGEERLEITGSSTLAPLFNALGERYEEHTGTRVDVQSGGTGRGINDVATGMAPLAMASRRLTAEERDAGLREAVIGRDAVVPIVHADNPVGTLTDQQVMDTFRGNSSHWPESTNEEQRGSGKGPPVTVVNKSEGRATLAAFLEHFALENSEISADIVAGENEQVIRSVAGNPGAIGYVSLAPALAAERRGDISRVALEGQEASVQAVREDRYPLVRDLVLVTPEKPDALTRDFMDFIREPEQQELISDHSFIPVGQE